MDDPSLWIALGALVVSAAAFGHSVWASRREHESRSAELELLRQQLESEDRRRDEESRAHITARQAGSRGSSPQDEVDFILTNVGPALAQRVRVYVESESGRVIAGPVESPAPVLSVANPVTVTVHVPTHALDGPEITFLTIEWTDAAGSHQDPRALQIKPLR